MQLGLNIALHGAATLGVHLCIGFHAGLRQMALQSGRRVKVLCKKMLGKMQEIPNHSCLINTAVQRPHQQSCYVSAVIQ